MVSPCSKGSSVLCPCPTPRRRTCGPHGLSLRPSVPTRSGRLPEVSRFSCRKCLGVLGVYDYAGLARASRYRLGSCGLPLVRQRRRPDCAFSKLNTQPTYSPVYASLHTSRRATQNSGPSGSLLLPRKEFSSSASCRFIPALPDRRLCGPRFFRSHHRHRALFYRSVETPALFSFRFLYRRAPAQAARAIHRARFRLVGTSLQPTRHGSFGPPKPRKVVVTPAKAGIHVRASWIPAFAGMTSVG